MLKNEDQNNCSELLNNDETNSFSKEIEELHSSYENEDQDNSYLDKTNNSNQNRYYLSYLQENLFEVNHIKETLLRKQRIVLMDKTKKTGDFELNKKLIEQADTFLSLWNKKYIDDTLCKQELDYAILSQKNNCKPLKIIGICLDEEMEYRDVDFTLCLSGIDRVARELAMFRLIQEETIF